MNSREGVRNGNNHREPDPPFLTPGTPIASGRTAEIFPWGDGHILKLTRADFPSILADQEWQNAYFRTNQSLC